jgi:hypothetical protein
MSRREATELLLKYVERVQFGQVRRGYNCAIQTRSVPEFFPIRIKNLCENLRSVLDYLALDIWDLYGQKGTNDPKVYFPIRGSLEEYAKYAGKLFPDLKPKNLGLWKFLERMQPVPGSGERWLGEFNSLNNRSKHLDLVLHRSRSAPVGHPKADEFGPVVHLDEQTNEWVEFRFVEPDVNALMLIHSAVVGVRFIVNETIDLLP